jgi:hypothetical protein
MSDDVAAELREQFTEAFEGADYPVSNQMDLVPALPSGPGTTFEAGDVTIGAMELGRGYADYQEYPYDSVEELVDDLMDGLHDRNVFE